MLLSIYYFYFSFVHSFILFIIFSLLCFPFIFQFKFVAQFVSVSEWAFNFHSTQCNLQIFDYLLLFPYSISYYYEFSKEQDFICSKPEDSGMHMCSNLPPYRIGPMVCNCKYRLLIIVLFYFFPFFQCHNTKLNR